MDLFSEIEESVLPFSIPSEIDSLCRWDNDKKVFFIRIPHGELIFCEHFFNKKVSDRSVEYFQENDRVDWRKADWSSMGDQEFQKIKFANIHWKRDKIKIYGNEIPLPRLTAWYGDKGMSYTYSGITSQPEQWNEGLLYIKKEIESISQEIFNSVLLNWYRSGEDHLSWHADDERELGVNPVIASVNFGETRDFIMRRTNEPSKKISIPLKHGTLLIMGGEFQHFWQHYVPKRKDIKGSRFNLTFRRIFPVGAGRSITS